MKELANQLGSTETQSYFAWLRGEDGGFVSEVKEIGDGLYAATKPLLFHWTLIVGQIGDRYAFMDRWCYETQEKAEAALKQWSGQGEPEGWHRHPASGRRRPGGDPTQEYFAP